MQRALLFSGFLLSASLLFVTAQTRTGGSAAPSAPSTTRIAPGTATTPGTTPINTPQLTDTIGQPVGATPTQGTAAQIPNTNAGATNAAQTGTTSNTTPPSSVPGQIQVTGPPATMPPQTELNTSLTPAQVIGTGNFGGSNSAWSMPVNQQNLADAAREARQKLAKDHPRTFTNNDIARLRQAAGEPATTRPGLVTNEQTMPASDVTAPNVSNPDNQHNPNSTQMPASDQTPNQTTPPTMNQNRRRPSPFRPKK